MFPTREINESHQERSFKGGLNLKFIEPTDFESIEQSSKEERDPVIVRNALRILMMGWNPKWRQLISWATCKAIFVQRDINLLRELRLAFQQGFDVLYRQIQPMSLSATQNEQIQLYLSNCLSLLPFSDLTPYESIKIPQRIDGHWELVEYQIVPIELTSTTGIKDQDRVFAYGLEPLIHGQAKSHLIFMGTTYPAGQGFISQIHTDLKAFQTVGESLYKAGRAKILQWLSKQNDKVCVSGMSLGGALSLLLAVDQGDKLFRVDAQNPPGLYESTEKSEFDRWDELMIKPPVIIQQQAQDPVSAFGSWKTEWTILKVIPPPGKKGPNALWDHFLNYAGFEQTRFEWVDPEQENHQRQFRNYWLYKIGRSFLYYLLMLPYTYVGRPVFHFIWAHKLSFSLVILTFLASIALIMLTTTVIAPPVLLTMSLVLVSMGLALMTTLSLFHSHTQETTKAQHALKLGFANLHDPKLARNVAMDIYHPKNSIELKLTYKEINTYYKMVRCLIKKKDFLPSEASLAKRELLEASEDPEKQEQSVTLKVTKAKASYIKRTIRWDQRVNLFNEPELRQVLEQEYRAYRVGKNK